MSRSAKSNKLPVISLFSGAMGLDLGLERAGFTVAVAVECNKYAVETIRLNRPDLPIIDPHHHLWDLKKLTLPWLKMAWTRSAPMLGERWLSRVK